MALEAVGRELRKRNWQKQAEAGLDLVTCNDFSFYDQVLDATCLFGNVPKRFHWQGGQVSLETLFTIARGTRAEASSEGEEKDCQTGKVSTFASEMTKWFDTNYHYIVPEFDAETTFALSTTKILTNSKKPKRWG